MNTTRAIITQGNPLSFLARLKDSSGDIITQADIASIVAEVWNSETATMTATSTPAINDVVSDELILDGRWTTDAIGYNLAVDIDGSAFDAGDTDFQIQVDITSATGSSYRIVGRVHTQPVFIG